MRPSMSWTSLIVVSKVASTVAVAEKMDIRVGWIEKVVEAINGKRDHFAFL